MRPLRRALTAALDLLIVNRVEADAYVGLNFPMLETGGHRESFTMDR